MKFWNKIEEHQYLSLILNNARAILTFFGATYFYETSLSKLGFKKKNKYRNHLSNAHLDDLLWLSTSKSPVNINKDH